LETTPSLPAITACENILLSDRANSLTLISPYTDVTSFVGLATVIENVGVSAYAGAAQYITTAEYTTVAAVILTTEARHQSWQSSAVSGLNPWGSAYDTPLGLDMVYTIASAFITSCPSSNPALPVMAFPALNVTGNPGDNVAFSFKDSHNAVNYAIFYSGLGTAVVQLDANDMATIPSSLQGIAYVIVSTASSAADVTNSNVSLQQLIVYVNHAEPNFFFEDHRRSRNPRLPLRR